MDSIAICAIFKNEARYLLEWIGYHRMIGVDHFVLYDNSSTDGGPALIRRSPFTRHVTLIDWPMQVGQLPAFADFIANQASRFTWVAFIDLDEFIQPLETDSIRPLLPRYDGFSGVVLHWLLFGPSGHDASPPGLVLENYWLRLAETSPVNQHVKSLVRTSELVAAHTTPHILVTAGPLCNTRGELVPAHARHDQPCHDVMVLNHYLTRSAEDWRIKTQRGRSDVAVPAGSPSYPQRQFNDIVTGTGVEDRRVARFLPRLRWVLRDAPATLRLAASTAA